MENESKGLNHWQSITADGDAYCGDGGRSLKLLAIYQHNDVVHGCVDVNAKGAVAADCGLYRVRTGGPKVKGIGRVRQKRLVKAKGIRLADDDQLELVTSHPLLDALNNPDEDLDLQDLLRLTVIDLCVFGISYWLKEGDGLLPRSYRSLPPYCVTPQRDGTGRITGYFYTSTIDGGTKKSPLPKEDVIVFRWPSPADRHGGGDSPLMSALSKVALSNKWTEWQHWLIDNRARPDGVFIPKGEGVSPEEAKRQEKRITDKFKGPGNGRWAVAEGPGQWVPLMFPPTDLAPLQFNEELRKAVLFALNIPEAFSNNDGNRANLEGSLEQWARQSLSPILSLLARGLNTAAKDFGDDLIFCFDNVIPEDEKFELEEQKAEDARWVNASKEGVVTVNEYRARLGLDPIDGGDDLRSDAAPVPVAPDAPADGLGATQGDGQKQLDLSVLLQINDAVAGGTLDRATAINLVGRACGLPDEEAKRLVGHKTADCHVWWSSSTQGDGCACGKCPTASGKAASKGGKPAVVPQPDGKGLVPILRKHFGQQLDHYLGQIGDTKGLEERVAKAFADDAGAKASDGLPEKFVPLSKWDESLAHDVKPLVELYARDGADWIKTRVGASPDVFAVVPAKIKEAVAGLSLEFAQSTNQTTATALNDALDQLRGELEQGLLDGDSVKELRRRVQSVFENADADRAELIAQTESSRAVHAGLELAARESGVVKGFKWLLSEDACPICKGLDKKTVELGQAFIDGEGYDRVPYPPAHPGCRCAVTEIIDEGEQGGGGE